VPIDYAALKSWPHKQIRHDYTARDTILYGLGLGVGADPLDPSELRYVYEESLMALPTMAAVVCTPGFWLKEEGTGIDWKRVLHAEQSVTIHRPLAPVGTVVAVTVIDEIIDKGEGRGALIYQRRELQEADTGEAIATVSQSSYARGDGGFGGPAGPLKPVHAIPDRPADLVLETQTRRDLALLYRLNGDYNPLHADPEVARAAGFDRPILHGLCTYGIAGRAVLRGMCNDEPARLRQFDVRFSAPVMPGDTIRTEMWRPDRDGRASFRCSVPERGAVVLNNGLAVIA
jgi:acyl dehydratase